jgi:hypothetical protein
MKNDEILTTLIKNIQMDNQDDMAIEDKLN